MSERRQPGRYDGIARKWLDLAERRKAHFIELYDSGRWKHYYSESEMIAEVRAAVLACDDWAKIVGVPPHANASASERGTRQASYLPDVVLDQRYRV